MRLTTFVLISFALPTFSETLEVGPRGSGKNFEQIQDAIDAAGPGDTVVVSAGTYAPIHIDKAITVLGDGPDLVTVTHTSTGPYWLLDVESLPSGEQVLLSGMSFVGAFAMNPGVTPVALAYVHDCQGVVVLHEVEVRGEVNNWQTTGLESRGSRWLIADSCRFSNPAGLQTGIWGIVDERAVNARYSTLWLLNSLLKGADGVTEGFGSTDGLGGLSSRSGTVYAARTQIIGGEGDSDSFGFPFASKGSGGWGVYAYEGATVTVHGGPGSLIQAGLAGPKIFGYGSSSDGSDLFLNNGSAVTVAADVPRFDNLVALEDSTLTKENVAYPTLGLSSPDLKPGERLTVQTSGSPGATVRLYLSTKLGIEPTEVAGVEGLLALDSAHMRPFDVLTNDDSLTAGTASANYVIPNEPSLGRNIYYFQTIETSSGTQRLSNPAVLRIDEQ